MDFVRLLQHMNDASPMRDLTMVPTRDISTTNETNRLKMLVKEKEVIISSLQDEIHKMKDKIQGKICGENVNGTENVQQLKDDIEILKRTNSNLEIKNSELEQRLTQLSDLTGINNLLNDYEKMLENLLSRCMKLEQEKNLVCRHLACLEFAFTDLLEKYERAKTIIYGYQQNQEVLIKQATKYENSLSSLEEKNKSYIEDTQKKMNEFIEQLSKREKVHIGEVAKLKTKILQSQVKINDLEKQLSMVESVKSNISETSLFRPLSNIS